MNWKIGMMAEVICPNCEHTGKIVQVLRTGLLSELYDGGIFLNAIEVDVAPSKKVQVKCPNQKYACFKPEHLKPIYDGDQKGSWDDCVWKPRELVQ